eukprot:6208819-Pleurochrysis_carterae.AAC.4
MGYTQTKGVACASRVPAPDKVLDEGVAALGAERGHHQHGPAVRARSVDGAARLKPARHRLHVALHRRLPHRARQRRAPTRLTQRPDFASRGIGHSLLLSRLPHASCETPLQLFLGGRSPTRLVRYWVVPVDLPRRSRRPCPCHVLLWVRRGIGFYAVLALRSSC